MNFQTSLVYRLCSTWGLLPVLILAFFNANLASAQSSIEESDTPNGWVHVSIRTVDPWGHKRFTVTVTSNRVAGVDTHTTHTPSQVVAGRDGHSNQESREGKLISSPGEIVYRFPHRPGHEYTFTLKEFVDCQQCLERDSDYVRDSLSDPEFEKKRLGVRFSVRGQFEVPLDGKRYKSWAIDNQEGLLTYVHGSGYFLDTNKIDAQFTLRCIDGDLIRKKYDPLDDRWIAYTATQLDAYKFLSKKSYDIQSASGPVTVRGSLFHSNIYAKASNRDAVFEKHSSEQPLPCMIGSHGRGDFDINSYHEYKFVPIDVVEGGHWTEARGEHPAGTVPAGFRAVTFKCQCCEVNPKYVVAFAGTDVWDLADWYNNIWQGTPMDFWSGPGFNFMPFRVADLVRAGIYSPEQRVAPQYEFAVRYVRWVINKYLNPSPGDSATESVFRIFRPYSPYSTVFGSELIVTGHSLGGGLASYVSGKLKLRGFGYNSAPLASGLQVEGVKKFASKLFTQVRTRRDPVSGILPYLPGDLVGEVFTIDSTHEMQSAAGAMLYDHLIGSMGSKILSYQPAR